MDLEKAAVVKTFLKLTDADLAAAQLHSAGIECAITCDDAGGTYPHLALIKLSVDPARFGEARQILDEPAPLQAPSIVSPADSHQPLSAHPAPAPFARFGWGLLVGTVIGALLHLGYTKSQQFGRRTYRYDSDRDGTLDEEYIWQDGQLVEFRRDCNGDGRIDHWMFYTNGIPAREELDDNFDGRIDAWYTFDSRGVYSSARLDTDFNGVPDCTATCKNGMPSRCDWQPNGTNVITLRQIFENGVLKEELRDEDWDGQFDVSIKYGPFSNPVQTNYIKLLPTPAQ